jgi:hypothetical protein
MNRMRWGLAIALISLGCQNNTVDLDFDDAGHADDSNDDGSGTGVAASTGGDDAPSVDTGADTFGPPVVEDGNWLLAIETPLQPGVPFQWLVTIMADGAGTYTMSMQSLSLDPGSTTAPRQLVGDVKMIFGVPLGVGIPVALFTGPLFIPAAANPITATDTTVDILLDGTTDGDPYCGTVSGAVVSPVMQDLSGATFGTTRVVDVTALPATFPTRC